MSVPDTMLSIIMTSCNQLGPLKFSLLALLDQQPEVPFEIIVVDCGSTDGSDQFLTMQAEKGSIRAIFAGEGKGRTAARNQGAHVAFGRHLMFLDPGILVAPGWSESLVRALEKDLRLAAVAGRILLPDGKLDHAGLALLQWPATETSRPKLTTRSIHAGRGGNFPAAERNTQVQALAGEALMVRSTSFFAVGGFSGRLGREHNISRPDYEGDPAGVDICLRFGNQGWTCVYRPEAIMTRLRTAETHYENHERDMAILGRTWLDRVHPDFRIGVKGGATPGEHESIRPYVEPVLNFQAASARGMVDPDGRSAKAAASVIVSTNDDLALTRQCLTALLANTDPCHEILILDSGTDLDMNTYLSAVARQNSQIQLVASGDSTNEAQTVNQALSLCEGRHIVLLDRQVVVTPGWLETLIGTAEMNPRAGLVGPLTNKMNGLQQVSAVDYDTTTLDGLGTFATRQMMQHASKSSRTMRLGGFCLLIKRELLARVGGLDTRFDGGLYEFNDYCLRVHMAGFECLIARGCYVHHQQSEKKTEVGVDPMMQLEIQFEIFKRKWKVPASIGLNSQLDLNSLLVGGFDPALHFHCLGTLPEGDTKMKKAVGRHEHQGVAQT
jgi:GT2 family glycosyltransferase